MTLCQLTLCHLTLCHLTFISNLALSVVLRHFCCFLVIALTIIITIMRKVIKISMIIMLVTMILIIIITVLGSVVYHTQNLHENNISANVLLLSSGLILVWWLIKFKKFHVDHLSHILFFPVQIISSTVATSSQTTPAGN